ncbi:MAG: HNH endonuclease [Deltaproteobacteria bacterium]|nr:HNH endonuclease [Deltaproteobacteria bacterium]
MGTLGLSYRGRDDRERRFQNPGKKNPVVDVPGTKPVIVGIWDEGGPPVLVAMDAAARIGRETRQSLFAPLGLLIEAREHGWREHVNEHGEHIFMFVPALLPTYAETLVVGAAPEVERLDDVIETAGLETPAARERVRIVGSRLSRDARFRKHVLAAYNGRCAMCGLNFNFVEAAHILPATAPASPDHVTNGLALCRNHHVAFDSGHIWVAHDTLHVHLSPALLAITGDASESFLKSTRTSLMPPASAVMNPSPAMFQSRDQHLSGPPPWAPAEYIVGLPEQDTDTDEDLDEP